MIIDNETVLKELNEAQKHLDDLMKYMDGLDVKKKKDEESYNHSMGQYVNGELYRNGMLRLINLSKDFRVKCEAGHNFKTVWSKDENFKPE